MPNSSDSTSLRDYLSVITSRKRLIAIVTVVSIAVGLGYSLLKSPTYEATATVDFRDPLADLPIIAPGTGVVPELNQQQHAAANTEIVTRDDVVRAVKSSLGSDLSPSELRDRISATVDPASNLVEIKASSGNADEAAGLANAFARQTLIAERKDVRASYADKAKDFRDAIESRGLDPGTQAAYTTAAGRLETLSKVAEPVSVTRTATVPSHPASPKPVIDTVLAAVLGLMLGIGVAFVRNAFDRRIRDAHQVQHELGLPLVGYVRADALGLAGIGRNGDSFVSEDDLEAFRILRTNVDFLAGDEELSSLVVTSALPEEGKSTVAAWYAYVSAVAGRRTLLVECDFRRPVLASRFGVKKAPGLSDYLAGEAEPKDVLRSVAVHGREAVDVLPLITAGDNVFQPTEMIGSQKFKSFVDQTTRAYDVVIFDSAPLLPVGDTLELIPQADGVLLCVRLGQTTRDQAHAAQQAMNHLPQKPTGLVITGVRRGSEDDYYGYYSYSSSSHAAATAN